MNEVVDLMTFASGYAFFTPLQPFYKQRIHTNSAIAGH